MTARKLTEDDVDALIEQRQEAARDAAAAVIQRAQRRAVCPPCNGNCNQSRTCPARLRAQVAADATASTPSTMTLVLTVACIVIGFAAYGLAKRLGVA